MNISIQFDDVPSPKDVAARLRMVAGVWEGKSAKEAARATDEDSQDLTDLNDDTGVNAEEDEAEETTTTRRAAAPAKAGKGKKAAKAEDEEFDLGEEETEEEEAEEEETIDLKSVISAFQTYAKDNSREKAAKVLAKFGVKSVRDLKEKDYAKVLKVLKA